ncbi:serine hydrolase domain-containing protein [Streptomyces flavofungini]|uniref:Beta-lactamase family protein n=1 Tax=Streptomyces flavofungini TaxID=68200 RepID=A0ABS0X0Z9_9ACTN|nr:serine hydrolase domain-containing protein [Streptomyces flavofungini]MBJ3806825.1 beta-lactamase family protein [Streptomyces flavofungini]GHC60297.1 D-alanyl-D-alanine carboxypeptidase [Streptomyces flavofungini]
MSRFPLPRSSRRLVPVLCALGTLGVAAPALADEPHRPPPPPPPHAPTQAALDRIVEQGTPGVIAQVRDRRGVWHGRAGVGDLATGGERGPDEKFRIASLSKTFTSVVLLKLEAEGGLSLDDSVEKWLPGVVRGKGYRPGAITVRHLLNHTSGIFDYNMDDGFRAKYAGDAFDKNRHTRWRPAQLVDIALAHPPNFQPEQGSRPGHAGEWDYSDTNYILAGMIIEKATGGPYEEAVDRLVIDPLGLRGTSVPGRSPKVPSPHATHYSTLFEDPPHAKVRDVTEFSPTVAFSAGQLISTVGDVNTFMSKLLRGQVLLPAQQRQLLDAIPVDGDKGHGGPDDVYGLGIRHFKLKEGCWAWGHGGMIPGSASRTVAAADGRHVLTMNRNGDWGEQKGEDEVVEAEFCGRN